MRNMELIAQGVGALGIGVFLLCFHFNSMKNVLKVKLLTDVIWGLHYFLLGAYTGFAANAICCVRELVFMNNTKKAFRSKLWLYAFIACNILSALLTARSAYGLLPAVASSLATVSFWQEDVRFARRIAVTNNLIMFTYDVFVTSYTGMIGESLAFFSVAAAMIKNRRTR